MNNQRRKQLIMLIIVVITCISVLFLLNYMKQSAPGDNDSLQTQAKIVVIPKSLDDNNDFWNFMIQGAEIAALENNAELVILATELETEIDKQNALIEEAIAMQPNAIALAPCDYVKTVPYAQKIIDAGIKLVILDSTMETDFGNTIVATDNVEAGRKMGEYMLPRLDSDSCIGIVGHVKGASTAVDREAGIRLGIGEYEKNIVDVVFCNSSYSTAYEVTTKMLHDYPEINVIFALNEYSAVGAGRALKDLGLAGKIKMIGFDGSLEEVSMMEEGILEATVVQKPLNMGYLGVKIAYEESFSSEIFDNVDSGSVLITKDTIYEEENQKLLFPFREK